MASAVDASLLRPSKTRRNKPPIESLHFVKRSMTRKAIMHPGARVSMQCMQGEDGAFYYIPLDSYNQSHLRIISELSPLLVNPSPHQFEPGAMYTYIVASIITKDPGTNMDIQVVPMKLYASKALNMFEFGTKHHQIFYRMALTPELDEVAQVTGINADKLQYALHASGEIRCIDAATLEFNFFSGTYKMQRKIPRRRAKHEMALITHLMQAIDPSYAIKFDFKPFILPELMPIKHAQLQHLERMGIPVFGFTTREKCRDMRIAVIRHMNLEKKDMTHAEMRSHYDRIVAPSVKPVQQSMQQPMQQPMQQSMQQSMQMPLHAMSLTELRARATALELPIQLDYDRKKIIDVISDHLKSKGQGGGNKRKKNNATKKK